MSEILPCAVCGCDVSEVVAIPNEGDFLVPYEVPHGDGCMMKAVAWMTVPQWNTLMKWIADGRAVEQVENLVLRKHTFTDGGFFWGASRRLGREFLAPTLAEAVRKAQGK